MLIAADLLLGPTWELVVLATATMRTGATCSQHFALLSFHAEYWHHRACQAKTDHRSPLLDPLFDGKSPRQDQPTLFVCEASPASSRSAAKRTLLALARELG